MVIHSFTPSQFVWCQSWRWKLLVGGCQI